MSLHRNRVQMTVTGAPGTGAITLNAATTGYQSFSSAYGADATVDILITEGNNWEVCRNCAYTNGTPQVDRGTLEGSSAGPTTRVSFGSGAVVSVIATAGFGNDIESTFQSLTPGGRLTLVSGQPNYAWQPSVAVSGQDTVNDTITVTAHGWVAGTMVTSSATSGGLTAGTQYFAGNITTNTISLHTTLAAALAGTSKVDITGTVTATINATGVQSETLYYTPYVHNVISLWNGSSWAPMQFTERSLALSSLTSGRPYDVFAFLSSGAVTIEILAWTSDTARATDVTLQDGRYCKSGDKTRLYLGTVYTVSATAIEDSLRARYVNNHYNKINQTSFATDGQTHTYVTGTGREWAGATTLGVSRFQFLSGFGGETISLGSAFQMSRGSNGVVGYASIAVNSTTSPIGIYLMTDNVTNVRVGAGYAFRTRAGLNFVCALELGESGVNYQATQIRGAFAC